MAVRGAKPKSIADKRIRGNPGERRLTTLVPTALGGDIRCPPNAAQDERAQGYWDLFVGSIAPGHLAPLDAPLLSRLCMALSRADDAEQQLGRRMLVKAPNSGLPIQSPYLAIVNRQTDLARKLASELALPPAQRSRFGGHDANEPDNPAYKYFQ